MAQALVDTSILIDIMRQYPPAIAWFLTQKDIGVSPISYMELVGGSRDKVDQQKALRLLSQFEIVFLTPDDFRWAMQAQINFGLAYAIGLPDFLIASPHVRLNIPLYSRNIKHFKPLLGHLVSSPY
jgi:predicted nucleic acid-binding protein